MKLFWANVILILYLTSCTSSNVESSKTESTNFEFPTVEKPNDTVNVGFLIMDGVFNTELTAPMDIFQHTIFHTDNGMKVFTVAKNLEPVRTFEGLRILPDYSYTETYPNIDVLVVPSAEHHLDTDLEDSVMINFVAKTSKTAKFVTSHCDGAFVLAKAGILDGVESTTFPGDITTYEKLFPQLTVHRDVIFVHDNQFITSAGGAKSFEASMYLVELLYGKKVADGVARGMVIDWNVADIPSVVVK